MIHFEVYTDGGFSFKKKQGSWAYVVVRKGKVIASDSGLMEYEGVTSQQSEMKAIISALGFLSDNTHPNQGKVSICLTSDSQYCVKGLMEWVHNWKRNNWINSSGNTVANKAAWKKMVERAEVFGKCRLEWVKGHNGNHYNEIVDRMCNEQLGRKV